MTSGPSSSTASTSNEDNIAPSSSSLLLQLEEILNPEHYVSKFTDHNVRPDNRPLYACRPTTILAKTFTKRKHTGSALVRLGVCNTQCVAATHLEVGICNVNSLYARGEIVVKFNGYSDNKSNRNANAEAREMESFLNTSFAHSSGLFDLKQLVLKSQNNATGTVKSMLAWRIVVNVVCLNEDGNVRDAAYLATLVALLDTTIPELGTDYIIREDNNLVQMIESSKSVEDKKLKLQKIPIPLTVGIFDQGETNDIKLMVDPTGLEEATLSGTITVIMTADGEVVSVYKPGGIALNSDQIAACMQLGIGRAKEIKLLLTNLMSI